MKMEAIQRLNDDFEAQRGPFADATLPEQEALASIRDEDTLCVLAAGVQLDYNRSADQLWENILTLYHEYGRHFFQPEAASEMNVERLSETFADIGFRYCNRDAKAWQRNAEILVDEFGGTWHGLLESAQYDALRLSEQIEESGFLYLKGDKICPFFLKVVDMNVHELENVWELPVPVDIHIRRLTQELAGEELSDDEIRAFWKQKGEDNDINVMTADTCLWIIGNQWSNWGKEYWNSIV